MSLGEKREPRPGDLGYRGPIETWQLGYDAQKAINRQHSVEGAGAGAMDVAGGDSLFGGREIRTLWRTMRDSAFCIVGISPAAGTMSIGEGYVWGFTAGLKVNANTTVSVSGGTAEAPLFIYASGTVTPLAGTIASSAVVLASLPFGQENTWVCPLYRVHTADGLYIIMPVFHCPNLREHYGP